MSEAWCSLRGLLVCPYRPCVWPSSRGCQAFHDPYIQASPDP